MFQWARVVVVSGAVGVGAVACADPIAEDFSPPPATDVLWRLLATPRGITMAVGQSLTLAVTPLNILGEPMTLPDSVSITFRSNDTTKVTVSPTGLLTGRGVTLAFPGFGQLAPIPVYVSLTSGPVSKFDTIYVAVTSTAPANPPATVSIVPVAPYPADSTWTATYSTKMIPITMLTTTGDTIPSPYLYLHTEQWRSGLKEPLNPANRVFLFTRMPGRFWIYATGWAYGVEFQDSAEYVQTDFLNGGIEVLPNFSNPNEVVPPANAQDTLQFLAPCGQFYIRNGFPVPIDVTFDAGTAICLPGDEAGNVIALQPNQSTIRKFRSAGTYNWTVTRTGGPLLAKPFRGTIRVRAHTDF